jgi:hypothetical protein
MCVITTVLFKRWSAYHQWYADGRLAVTEGSKKSVFLIIKFKHITSTIKILLNLLKYREKVTKCTPRCYFIIGV